LRVQVAGLRASELTALTWKNVGWDSGMLQSQSAFVKGELKETKSRKNNTLPLAEPVLQVLRLWRERRPYLRRRLDFCQSALSWQGSVHLPPKSCSAVTSVPLSRGFLGSRAASKHQSAVTRFADSLATLLISNGENVKVAQSPLRHTTPKITLELYARAVSADQQKAHSKVVQMVLPMSFQEKLRARSPSSTA
jgi:integrase